MSESLEDPARLFDVRGKVAVVTGASGAFGSLAARVLAAAGARLVLAAGNTVELEATAAACRTTSRRSSTCLQSGSRR